MPTKRLAEEDSTRSSKRSRPSRTASTRSSAAATPQSNVSYAEEDEDDGDLGLEFVSDPEGDEDDDDDGDEGQGDDEDYGTPVSTSSTSKNLLPKAAKITLSAVSKARYSDPTPSSFSSTQVQSRPRPTHSSELVSRIFGKTDFSSFLSLKPDHPSRPLYISPSSASIILEAFHPLASQAQDFLIAISEPISRPSHIHEYKLTPYSLYAAVSVGLETEDIVEVLNRLSKVPVPEAIVDFIRSCTVSYGKVKLVLKKNRYYVESGHPDTLRMLLRDKVIGQARLAAAVANEEAENAGGNGAGTLNRLGGAGGSRLGTPSLGVDGLERDKAPKRGGLVIPGTKPQENGAGAGPAPGQSDADYFTAIVGIDKEDELDEDDTVHAFEIKESDIEAVKRRCNELDYPMLEEYAFKDDLVNPNLEIDLKPTTTIRPYQEKSLSKMFGNGHVDHSCFPLDPWSNNDLYVIAGSRARSGIIVLPCGAGKTLVGITAACTIKKSCLVLCTSGVSVMQWKQQFLQWSNIQDRQIAVFTAEQKEKFHGASGIVVSTYSMVANRQKRSHDAQKMMDFLTSREWGFILLDEVHVVPAAMFRRVVTTIKAHAKLGLTATLVREDDKIDDLNFLIGPKLYEANWMDLAKNGHIANVQCAEVWCPMTPEFYREYLREKSRKRMLLYCMNPSKLQACQFLIKFHEERGDKIIVFSDNVYALEAYAKKLKKLYIHGGTPQVERMRILQNFQHNPLVSTIFLSKVGDTSIDLPEATCLIQISSHFGSRRQEAQRLGRILRAKRRNDEGFNAFFYSLVSRDTQEMYYSTKRQQFLIDQGYAFKVITHLEGMEKVPDLVYSTQPEQIELLQSVLLANESEADFGTDVQFGSGDMGGVVTSGDFGGVGGARGGKGGVATAKRVAGNLTALSGASSMAYIERNRSQNKQLAKESKQRHSLFRKRDQATKERRKERAAEGQ